MKRNYDGAFVLLGLVLIWIACIVGYVSNIVQLALSNTPILESNLMIIKLIGFFVPPLGIVMGWIGFFL